MGYGWRRFLSTLALIVVGGSGAAGIVSYPQVAAVAVGIDQPPLPLGLLIGSILLGLAFSSCGYVILRQTANRVGWLLQVTGLLFGFIWIGLALSAFDAAGRDIGVAGRLAATWLGFGWYPALMLWPCSYPFSSPPVDPQRGSGSGWRWWPPSPWSMGWER
ncbi:hypothetical protein BH18ACT6_BH18ACT6_06130 [soil metagenome]